MSKKPKKTTPRATSKAVTVRGAKTATKRPAKPSKDVTAERIHGSPRDQDIVEIADRDRATGKKFVASLRRGEYEPRERYDEEGSERQQNHGAEG